MVGTSRRVNQSTLDWATPGRRRPFLELRNLSPPTTFPLELVFEYPSPPLSDGLLTGHLRNPSTHNCERARLVAKFRIVQHAAGVHAPSEGVRNWCQKPMHCRISSRALRSPMTVGAERFRGGNLCPPRSGGTLWHPEPHLLAQTFHLQDRSFSSAGFVP